MNEVEVFSGRGPIEHEVVSEILAAAGIESVTRTPAGIAAGRDPVGATTPFVVLVKESDAPSAEEALRKHDTALDDVTEEVEIAYQNSLAEQDTSSPVETGIKRFPPSPWSGRDLLVGSVMSVTVMASFLFFVWRESVIGEVSPVVVDIIWTGALLLGIVLPIWLVTVRRKGSSSDAFIRPISPGIILFTVLGAFLFWVVDAFVWELTDSVLEIPSSSAYWWGREAPPQGLGLAALTVTSVLLAPLGEEILYRGILLRYFGSLLRPGLAVTINALIFAVLHFQPTGIPSRFLFGVLAAWLVYWTRSLYPTIAFHMTLNAMSLMAFAGSA